LGSFVEDILALLREIQDSFTGYGALSREIQDSFAGYIGFFCRTYRADSRIQGALTGYLRLLGRRFRAILWEIQSSFAGYIRFFCGI